MTCNWNKSWTPTNMLDKCVWIQCIDPPSPPQENQMISIWNGIPVEFGNTTSYKCSEEHLYFEADRNLLEWEITCQDDGSWQLPSPWPRCLESKFLFSCNWCYTSFSLGVNCTEPPVHESGTRKWSNSYSYGTEIIYSCGPYAMFQRSDGTQYKEAVLNCSWNKTWNPPLLDYCQGILGM